MMSVFIYNGNLVSSIVYFIFDCYCYDNSCPYIIESPDLDYVYGCTYCSIYA